MDSTYKYEFKNKCYPICPYNTESSEIKEYYCIPQCSKENPFALIESQECVNNCTIDELKNNICIYNYDKENIKFMSNYITKEIKKENFNVTDIYYGKNIIIEEKYANFSITIENMSEIFECENILKNYYNINNDEKIIKLKTEYIENETIIDKEYNLFYRLDNKSLQQLDISICSCKDEKCSLCSNSSLQYDQCISCNDNYYPILSDTSNIYSYINCYQNPEGYYLDINESFYKKCYFSCETCIIKGDEENHNCITCDNNYKYELNINNSNYINCYEKCDYYFYFNKSEYKFYCTSLSICPNEYNKLKTDSKECIEDCKMDSTYKYEFKNKCYPICPDGTEISKTKEYYCNVKCPKQYPFEIVNTQECVKNCSINERKNKICITNYISEEEDKESTTVQDAAINNIREDLTSGFDTSDIDKGGDIIIEEKGIKLTITTTENQKNSENNKNATTINLGECETKLKQHYQIPLNKSLYILKLDVYQPGMKIPKIEYEVYYNLNGGSLVKLNLTVCENTKIHISLPAKLTEDLDKLNSSSAYYNDICYTSTSDSGTDISLSDRQNEFINNNKTLCEENCDLSKYNHETSKAICSCNIKLNIPLVSDINIDKNKFFESFTDINNIINYKIMKCYKNLFNIKNLKGIYGSFILIPFILFHFFCLIYASAKGNNELKNKIKSIVEAKNKFILVNKNYQNFKKNKKNELKKPITNLDDKYNKEHIDIKKEGNKENIENSNIDDININEHIDIKKEGNKGNIENSNNILKVKDFKNLKKKKRKKKKSIIQDDNLQETKNKLIHQSNKNFPIKDSTNDINPPNSILYSLKTENIGETAKQNHNFKLKDSTAKKLYSETLMKYKKIKMILNPNANEINSLPFKKALKHDKRTYFEYYCSLIKTQHSIFFSFCPISDYNIKIIKIDLFFIDIILNYTINALFFNDNTMHQIYEDQGEFNVNYQIPQIVYSSLISDLFSIVIKFTALTEDTVLILKHSKKYENFKKKAKITKKIINVKFILFCLLSSLMILVFFYYDMCFCVVYKNTQIHLISDFLFSFSLSLFYPFIFYLLPGILRIPAINKKKEILYKISKIIQGL